MMQNQPKPRFGSRPYQTQREEVKNTNNIITAVQKKEIINLDIDLLAPYSEHPFKLYEGERLDDMVSSIKEFGIIFPITFKSRK